MIWDLKIEFGFKKFFRSIRGLLQTQVVFQQRLFSIKGHLPLKVIFLKRLSSIKGQFLILRQTLISNMSLLRSLEPFKKFVVAVVGGGGGWWWLRVILVLSFDLSQAEQQEQKPKEQEQDESMPKLQFLNCHWKPKSCVLMMM